MNAVAFVVRFCYKSAIGLVRGESSALIATFEDAGDELVTSISSIITLITAWFSKENNLFGSVAHRART
jgi:hypothetical protein